MLQTVGIAVIVVGIVVGIIVLLIADAIKKDAKMMGPWKTSVMIHWIDRSGQGWITGPLLWQETPNGNGPTDDLFVVRQLIKTCGGELPPLPVRQEEEKKAEEGKKAEKKEKK